MEEIESDLAAMKENFNLNSHLILLFIINIFSGLIISLIISSFLRKNRKIAYNPAVGNKELNPVEINSDFRIAA